MTAVADTHTDIVSNYVSRTSCVFVYMQFGVCSIWNKQHSRADIYKSAVFAAQGLRFVSVSK